MSDKLFRILHVNNNASLDEYNHLVPNSDVMVLYYMDGCGHCEMMKPEWQKFEDKYRPYEVEVPMLNGGYCMNRSCPHRANCPYAQHRKRNPFVIARVNADYLNMAQGDKNIMGYPTIYMLHNGKKVSEFSGERKMESLQDYLEKQLSSSKVRKSKSKSKTRSKRKSRSARKTRQSGGKRKTRSTNRRSRRTQRRRR